MALQNFVARRLPTISAAWLNAVDVLKFTVFNDAATKPAARTALQIDAALVYEGEVTGTGNAVVVTLAGPVTGFAPIVGTKVGFTPIATNTGAATLNVNAGGAAAVLNQLGNPLTGGELSLGIEVMVVWLGASWRITAGSIPIDYARSAAEITAAVFPTRYIYPPGDIRRFVTDLTGATDQAAQVRDWVKVKSDCYFSVPGTVRIDSAITLFSDTSITGSEGAIFTTAVIDINHFAGTSLSNVKIQRLKFLRTASGNAASVAGVTFDACTFCEVRDCEFEGMQWAGVFLNNTNNCLIDNNHIHSFLANAAGDKSDIVIYRNSNSNIVSNNKCFGGLQADVGILVQDPGVGVLSPRWNKIINNLVGDHRTYGIIFYMGDATQQGDNLCQGNTVQNITGTGNAGNSGTGIYAVGNGLGAMIISANTVRNCCISTTGTSNGPAGISVNGTTLTGKKIIIDGNSIEEMPQAHGILVSTILSGAAVTGNTIRIPATNNGTGPGGASLLGQGIRVTESNAVTIGDNSVEQLGTGDCFFGFNTAASSSMITVCGNTFRAAGPGHSLRFDRLAAFTHTDVTINGNHLRNDGAGNLMMLVAVERIGMTGNVGGANTGVAIDITGCTFVLMAGNSFNTNNATGLSTAGVCTGSKYDISNRTPGNLVNGATGFRMEFLGGIPGAGTFVAGDTVWHVAPAAGASPGAICTTGGSPGTWKAMANLAP